MEEKEEVQEIPEKQTESRPALTINIQSWTTPIVGVVMLVLGLLGGYYGRALIAGDGEQAIVPQTIAPAQPQSAGAGNEEMMTYLVSQTRHFKGDQDAPVTLIEFGDFQ